MASIPREDGQTPITKMTSTCESKIGTILWSILCLSTSRTPIFWGKCKEGHQWPPMTRDTIDSLFYCPLWLQADRPKVLLIIQGGRPMTHQRLALPIMPIFSNMSKITWRSKPSISVGGRVSRSSTDSVKNWNRPIRSRMKHVSFQKYMCKTLNFWQWILWISTVRLDAQNGWKMQKIIIGYMQLGRDLWKCHSVVNN